jgi:fatty acid desaturase
MTDNTFKETRSARLELPTLGLIVLVYVVLITLVMSHDILPWWLLPIGAYFAALHVSLQHEVLHGHPTRHRWINEALVFFTPTLWVPYGRYRDTHLKHHNDIDLTDPTRDPESYYVLPEDWALAGPVKRLIYGINQTLAGRMAIGPAVSIFQFWTEEWRHILHGDTYRLREWALFGVSAAVTIVFVTQVAGMPFWKYYLLIAYPGLSLSLVRSYCEHRASERPEHRTIIVEASWFWSLLFLFNNLHVAHHTRPAMPWYRLPNFYSANRKALLEKNDGYTMKGYGEIFRRYFLEAKEPISYPNIRWLRPIDPGRE